MEQGGQTASAYWEPLFKGYEPARDWLAKVLAPDVAIIVYNDHANAFSLGDHSPTFLIGVADRFPIADEGFGPRPVPEVQGHPELAWHLAESLILDEFDMTIGNEMPVDHGLTVPLSITCGQARGMALQGHPDLRERRAVSAADRRPVVSSWVRLSPKAIAKFPQDLRRGHLWHRRDVASAAGRKRAGLINRQFDTAFLDNLTKEIRCRSTRISHTEYMRRKPVRKGWKW